jgi:hypothetical protein
MDINKELAGLLGLCWHKWEYGLDYCIRCKTAIYTPNPDFASDSGKIELLRLMMERGDWDAFLAYLYIHQTEDSGMEAMAKYITDTTGLLAQAAVEFLRREK